MSICNAKLFIADDYGDGSATMKCGLEEGHEGLHREVFRRGDEHEVTVTWPHDERHVCPRHGRQEDDRCDDCSVEIAESSTCPECHWLEGRLCPTHAHILEEP